MQKTAIVALVAAMTFGIGAADATPSAQDGSARRTVTVTLGGLDLATADGHRTAERRLTIASQAVCADVLRASAARSCRSGALSAAERQLALLVREERGETPMTTER